MAEEVELSSRPIKIYKEFRILLCTIGDAEPQEVIYDPKVGVNIMSSALAETIAPEEPCPSLVSA